MKRAVLVLAVGLLATDIAQADIYVKSTAMGGAGVNESWYSGKKKRETTHVDLGNIKTSETTITRVDKNVEWMVDNDLHMYREQFIVTPDTPGDSSVGTGAANGEKWDTFAGVKDHVCVPDVVVIPGKRTIAGFEATGYKTICKARDDCIAPRMIVWLVPAKGVLERYDKEVKAFEKAYWSGFQKTMTPEERKMSGEMLETFGAAGKMLLGFGAAKIPQGVPLMIEQEGAMPDGKIGKSVIFEIQEVRAGGVDQSLFELPAAYSKITNEEEYNDLKMQRSADQMGLGSQWRSMSAMQNHAPSSPDERRHAPVGQQAASNVPEQYEESEELVDEPAEAQNEESQGEVTIDDVDARSYGQ